MAKNRITLCVVVAVMLLLLSVPFVLWQKGSSELSSAYIDVNTMKPSPAAPRLFYRGIDVTIEGHTFVLFKRYYAIAFKDWHTGLTEYVSYEREGYNQFFISYESGQIAGHGLCMVGKPNLDGQILHDMTDVKEASYFAPDGQEVSTVKDGTGIITLHFADGSKFWEVELENYQRKKIKRWLEDGTVQLDEVY